MIAAPEKHVRWLDTAMNRSRAMERQPVAPDLAEDRPDLLLRKRSACVDERLQGNAVNMIAHHEVKLVLGKRPDFPGQDQVLVHERARLSAQIQKRRSDLRLNGELRPEHSDDDVEPILFISRGIGRSEQPLTQHSADPVRAVNRLECVYCLFHVEHQPLALEHQNRLVPQIPRQYVHQAVEQRDDVAMRLESG